MRRRSLAMALALLAVAGCSPRSDVSGSEPTTTATAAPEGDVGETSSTTGTTVPEEEVPVLEDVVPPEWQPTTRAEELLIKLDETDELSVQDAVDAFALVYPNFPGATPTGLPPGEGLSSSYVWMLINSVRDQLADDQLAFLEEHSGGEVIGTIGADGTFVEGPLDAGASTDPPLVSRPSGVASVRTRHFHAGLTAQVGRGQYVRFGELLGIAANELLTSRPDLPRIKVVLRLSPRPISGAMDAAPHRADPSFCEVRVAPEAIAANYSDVVLKYFFAHELFHCVQWLWNPDMDYRVTQWLFDGSAHFAAGDLYRATYNPPGEFVWYDWFANQTKNLQARTYDAWALFETWRQHGGDPYASIKAMVQNPSRNPAAVLATGGMDALFFRMDWSSRNLRSQVFPEEVWQLAWPARNSAFGPHDNITRTNTRGIGAYTVSGGGHFSHPEVVVRMTPEVGLVVAVPVGGPLTTHTADGTLHVAEGSPGRFCFHPSGCRCPDGATSDAHPMVGRGMIFSMPASATKPETEVVAVKWDPRRHCKERENKRGDSMGDPHLVSFDGLPFDIMTLGEFVTSRDPEGDLEIQTRHVPATVRPGAAATSAVAIGTGDRRITFTVADVGSATAPIVRVDGGVVTESSISLGEVQVERDGFDTELTWPDGTRVELTYFFGWFVTIFAPSERAARLEGLLGGGADGNFTNDLRHPDGTIVDPVEAAKPESEFSLAWAVDEDTSLFDYEPGESPATFRIPTPDVDPFELLEEALATCTAALGPQAVSHEVRSCAYDISATGNEGYVEAYESVVTDRVASAASTEVTRPTGGGPATAGREGDPTLTLSGTLAAPYSDDIGDEEVVPELVGTLEAASGTVLIVRAERCMPEVTLFAYVTNVDSGSSGSLFLCDPFGIQSATAEEDDEIIEGEVYFWLPAGGDFEVRIESDAEDAVFVTIEVFVDPSPTVVPNEEMTTGAQTTLQGISDTVVYLSSSGNSAMTFDATGLDSACAIEAYGAPALGSNEVWPLLGYCPHATRASVPGLDVPLVVFGRTENPIEVVLTP